MYKILIILFIMIFASCTKQTPEEYRISETLGKDLNLRMFDTIRFQGDSLSLDEVIQRFKYISVVYLQNGCSPCYDKYVRWHKEMNKIAANEIYTILFIIRGKNVEEFLNEVDLRDFVDHKYFIVMDPNYYYPEGNKEVIPDWMFERSILIDNTYKIRMVGQPFESDKSRAFFKSLILY